MTLQRLPSDLAGLLETPTDHVYSGSNITTYTDDLDALTQLESETKRAKTAAGVVVQHRSWSTQDIFRSSSQGQNLSSPSQTMPIPFLTSSPPPTPSPEKKRKFTEVDLGESLLARPAKAKKTYYGINIHQLLEEAEAEESLPKAAGELPTPPAEQEQSSKKASLLWTEKYRARKFTDLIGDERTHRAVMHWLKRWDPIVFPGSYRPKSRNRSYGENSADERPHRKILMLAGPPGLGKTTLAHVCARQAGYEVQEINASDERSSAVVKGRVRDMVGTENVKGVDTKTAEGKVRKAGKPVCVIIDEVDGVVGGSGGGGEGGFVKALIDLVMLDQKNSTPLGVLQQAPARNKKQGDRFRLLRPLILICNDVYHASLRPLRQSSHAEVIHVRKPPVQSLIARLQAIFDRENVPCESDGVRRLCEATWGVSNRKEDRTGGGAGEGDMRGIMVVGEWVAGKLRAVNESTGNARLTRRWVEDNVLSDLTHGGGAARGLGRGGPKDVVERVFQEGAGFPKSSNLAAQTTPQQHQTTGSLKGVAEGLKRTAGERLRELVDTHGDTDRIITDCFAAYPSHPFQDDTLLSKPGAASEWLHFHDCLSSAVYGSNEWELAPYLSTPVLGFHHLFASPTRAQYQVPTDEDTTNATPAHPFTTTQAPWAAHEATKHNDAVLQSLQSSLSLDLSRAFSSTAAIATDLLPYVLRMLAPNVNPIVVGGSGSERGTASVRKASEQVLVARAVRAMGAAGVRFETVRVNTSADADGGTSVPSYGNQTQWIYRMEPSLDELGSFETGSKGFGDNSGSKIRYAVRQVLDQEWRKEELRRAEMSRMARFSAAVALDASVGMDEDGSSGQKKKKPEALRPAVVVKRDFFGRPIAVPRPGSGGGDAQSSNAANGKRKGNKGPGGGGGEGESESEQRVWVTYHEGFSNAVRKPVTLAELMRDL